MDVKYAMICNMIPSVKKKKTTEAVSASTPVWFSVPLGHQGALEIP